MTREFFESLSIVELLKVRASDFGLSVGSSDQRRTIYKIDDVERFLKFLQGGGFDLVAVKKVMDYCERMPDALKQLFVVNQLGKDEKNVLGRHFHTQVEEGGSGTEIFVFVNVPSETNIKTERYELGRAHGTIEYKVQSGSVMRNFPSDYHVIESDGPFVMVQFLQGGFHSGDLKKFKAEEHGLSDVRMVEGRFWPWFELYNKYKGEFERDYPQAFEVMKIGGVHPGEKQEIFDPYSKTIDRKDFRNIGEHNISVAICANFIAEKLFSLGIIDQKTKDYIVNRALIHDANKRFEIFRRDAAKAGRLEGPDTYSVQAYEAVSGILKELYPDNKLVDEISLAGKETGSTSMLDFLVIDEDGKVSLRSDLTVAQLVVHLADDMTASPLPGEEGPTRFLTFKERSEAGKFKERYPSFYQKKFGFDEEGKPSYLNDRQDSNLFNLKSEAEWYFVTTHLVAEKLQALVDPNSKEDPELFIKRLVNNI
jgi:hypothetical protein